LPLDYPPPAAVLVAWDFPFFDDTPANGAKPSIHAGTASAGQNC
jgi:hypothetical protein